MRGRPLNPRLTEILQHVDRVITPRRRGHLSQVLTDLARRYGVNRDSLERSYYRRRAS